MRILILTVLFIPTWFVSLAAQDTLRVDQLPSDSIAVVHDSVNVAVKKNILQKLLDYLDDTNKEKEDKNFDFSIIGGPHYSSSVKFGVGLVGAGLFRIDKKDKSISPSNISLVTDVSTSGFYMLGVTGNILFPKEKYRLDFETMFSSFPSKYWGKGYDAGRNEYYSKYTLEEIKLRFDFLRKMAPNTYLGIAGMYYIANGKKFRDKTLLNGERTRIGATGVGMTLSYDSRDFIPNPSRGIYAKVEEMFHPKFLGSTENFNKLEVIARYYTRVWNGGILAFDLQGTFNNGDVPWAMNSMLGGSRQMRGYFEGRYNDKKLIQTQIELRQHIYARSGAVVWIGAGNVFPKFSDFEWDHTLPTYGFGYRWEFKKRVNVRLDYGIGKGESAFYFNVNEAF